MASDALGIDIGGTKIACVLADKSGHIHAQSQVPTQADQGIAAVIAQVVRAVDALGLPIHAGTVRGVGVGVPGHIDAAAGMVRYAVNLGWRDVALRDLLQVALGLPVTIENDAAALHIGEGRFGAARGVADTVFLSIGTGLGASARVDGRLVRGVSSFAMELGQLIRLEPQNHGVPLEDRVSGRGLALLAESLSVHHPGTRLSAPYASAPIIDAARAGDPLGLAVLDAFLADVCELAVWTCSVLNPARLILGGGMAHALSAELLAAIRSALDERTSPPVRGAVTLVLAEVTQTALGAAALVG